MSGAFGALVRRWAETDWDSILHERRGVEVHTERGLNGAQALATLPMLPIIIAAVVVISIHAKFLILKITVLKTFPDFLLRIRIYRQTVTIFAITDPTRACFDGRVQSTLFSLS
jgi:hypothetical protein